MPSWYRATTIRTTATTLNTVPLLLAQLNTFFTDCSNEGASFLWTVASYSASSPWQLTLKRKNNSPGRLTFFGGATASTSAVIGAGNWSGLASAYLEVCYDPTATSDTPASWIAGNPWSAANSLGRGVVRVENTFVPIHRMRAFCSDDGQLFLHGQTDNTGHVYMVHVGPIFRAASGGSTVYEGLCVQGARQDVLPVYALEADPSSYVIGTSSPNLISFGNPVQSANGYSGTTQSSYCSAYISGTWYQLNRVSGGRFTANSMTDGSLRMHFLPVFWVATPDTGALTPSVLKSKNLGMGTCRNRDAILIDSNSVTRGFYLGYQGTLGSDLTALSILNDDI